MRIIAVTNIKGGVGKTTTAVNLAHLCAMGGSRTVLWDLDPQGAATWTLRIDPAARGTSGLADAVPTVYPNLAVIPAGDAENPTLRLLRMHRELAEQCDTLFMDCPPGLSLLSGSVLRSADALIVPLVPTPLSVRMLDELAQYIHEQQWTDLALLPMFSMVDDRKVLHHEVTTAIRMRFPQMLPVRIPYSSLIERVAQRREPLNAFAPNSVQAWLYRSLWAEVQQRLPR